MRIECPSCRFSADIDSRRIPATGGTACCPRCRTRFALSPEKGVVVIRSACPSCDHRHEPAGECPQCGLIYLKFEQTQERLKTQRTMSSEPQTPVPRSGRRFGTDRILARSRIFSWSEQGFLPAHQLPRALDAAGLIPTAAEWRHFLDRLALTAGSIFLALGVVFFVAYNWKDLGRFTKFGIVEALLVISIIAAVRLGTRRQAGQLALVISTLLTGALLALVGQTYNSAVDNWELFAVWAAAVAPWVAAAAYPPLILLWLGLVNLAVGIWHADSGWTLILLSPGETGIWSVAAIDTAALALWEAGRNRGIAWLQALWPPKVMATHVLAIVTVATIWGIVHPEGHGFPAATAYGGWLAATYYWYRTVRRDLFILSVGVVSIICVVTAFLAKHLVTARHPVNSLFICLIIIAMSAAGTRWLRGLAAEDA